MSQVAPYSCSTAMLEVARERGVEGQGAFKVILGVRKLIKTYSRQFILAARELNLQHFRDTHLDHLRPLRDVPMAQVLPHPSLSTSGP